MKRPLDLQIHTGDHDELMSMFEKDHRGYRLDREEKSYWKQGQIYQSGETNALFTAYRMGAAYAIAKCMEVPA